MEIFVNGIQRYAEVKALVSKVSQTNTVFVSKEQKNVSFLQQILLACANSKYELALPMIIMDSWVEAVRLQPEHGNFGTGFPLTLFLCSPSLKTFKNAYGMFSMISMWG